MRAFHLVTLLFVFKYSMENQNKSLFCGALFSLFGILEVCGIDLVDIFDLRSVHILASEITSLRVAFLPQRI